MKTKLLVLALGLLIAWGLKRHYADARADDLWWILGPTAHVVGVVTHTTFVMQPGEGYLSREQLFLIEKSCAGVNFMIASFAMLMFVLVHRVDSVASGARVLALSLTVSYGAAVCVNAVRIVIAMWLAARPLPLSLAAADVHRLEGIVVYFGGLVLLFEAARWLDGADANGFRRAVVPLAAYYGITLLVPLANGVALSSEAFVTHALVVLIVPPVIIALARLPAHVRRSHWRRERHSA